MVLTVIVDSSRDPEWVAIAPVELHLVSISCFTTRVLVLAIRALEILRMSSVDFPENMGPVIRRIWPDIV